MKRLAYIPALTAGACLCLIMASFVQRDNIRRSVTLPEIVELTFLGKVAHGQATPEVNQDTIITWVAATGATSYSITAQTGVGHPLGDGVNIKAATNVGNVLQLPISSWLAGQQLDQPYQIFIRPENANEVGPWSDTADVILRGLLQKVVLVIP